MKAKSKPRKTKAQVVATITRYVRKAQALGVATGMVMPWDEIRLGYRLSEQPRAAVLPKLLKLAEHPNMHARRVAFSALRHLKGWKDKRALEALLRGLTDPEGWVRYDAAWALGESGTRDLRVLAALAKLARQARGRHDLEEDEASAAARALESLGMLRDPENGSKR